MANWTLAQIRTKARQLSGRLSLKQLSNDQLDRYINHYVQYTFPAEVKLDRNLTTYQLLTEANKQSYEGPSSFSNFVAPATIDNQFLYWYQDQAVFNSAYPEKIQKNTLGTGDGTTSSFSNTQQSYPILPGSMVITDDVELFQDTNTVYTTSNVSISGSLGGSATINYSTGDISVTFSTPPVDGANVYATYIQMVEGRPIGVLWYNNTFTFYPVPDAVYRFKVAAYTVQTVVKANGTVTNEFTSATDRPVEDEWGPTFAYGAARAIVADYGEMDSYQQLTALYKEQLDYINRKTSQNLMNVRAMPNF